ncbi:MAG: phage tail tube protein [Deltaproteobacteria bacterium]|nr:phage tail tube protein [Deltaproteobacteria bacterium]
MAYGRSGHLALHFQNSFGTLLTTSAHYLPLVTESVMETIGQVVESGIYGRLAESPVHEGLHEVAGEIHTEAHPIALGHFLKAALGQVTTTPQNSAFLHDFRPAATDWDALAALPPMTLEIHRDVGSAFLYGNLLADALSLEISQGQLLSASLSVKGGLFSRKAPAAAVFPAGRPWTWDVASAAYNGQAVTELRQLSVRFENQLALAHTLDGGRWPSRVKRGGPQRVAVQGAMVFQDQALFSDFLAQTERPLSLSLAGETVAGSYTNQLTLHVPKLRFTEFKPALSGPGLLEVSFSAKGVFDPGLGYALRATLVNTQPGY